MVQAAHGLGDLNDSHDDKKLLCGVQLVPAVVGGEFAIVSWVEISRRHPDLQLMDGIQRDTDHGSVESTVFFPNRLVVLVVKPGPPMRQFRLSYGSVQCCRRESAGDLASNLILRGVEFADIDIRPQGRGNGADQPKGRIMLLD
jgi:hypothetical protein